VADTPSLFDRRVLPEGFRLVDAFLTEPEESDLADRFRALEFHEVRMRGVAARRRVIQYGYKYSFETFKTTEGPPIPEFLLPIRDRAAEFADVRATELSEALITEYGPGATIGWHRDAAPFGVVAGISLLTPARFRFRRGKIGAWETTEVPLAPRSIYVLSGPARTEWEHSIPAVASLRYSITFRTLRKKSGSGVRDPGSGIRDAD
jgi:alkylated DNA repair dioxygenase AlkB